jgi:hypothetical protein
LVQGGIRGGRRELPTTLLRDDFDRWWLDIENEGNGRGLDRDSSILLVLAGVKKPGVTSLGLGNDTTASD